MPKNKDDFQTEVTLKEPGEGLVLWKPKKKGEKVSGKLMVITQTEFNQILRLSTDDGVISVPVTTFLMDIDFSKYLNQKLSFIYEGTTGKRNCKLFTVKVLQDKF